MSNARHYIRKSQLARPGVKPKWSLETINSLAVILSYKSTSLKQMDLIKYFGRNSRETVEQMCFHHTGRKCRGNFEYTAKNTAF